MKNRREPVRIGRRLAFRAGGAAFVLIALLVALLLPLERSAVERSAADQVGMLAEAVAANFAVVDEQKRSHHVEQVLEQLAHAPNVRAIDVMNHEGRVRFSTLPERLRLQPGLPPSLRDVRIDGDELVVVHTLPWTRACVGCHDAGHDPVGAVRVAVSRRAALSGLEGFHLFGGVGIVIVLLLALGILLFIADRQVSRPVAALARVMSKAEKGDFLVRAQVQSDDEIGELGHAFNRMLRSMTSMKASEIEREADLERAQAELQLKRKLEATAEELASANAMLERRVQAQQLLMNAAHQLGGTLDHDALLDRLVAVVERQLDEHDFALFHVEEEEGEAQLRAIRATGIAAHEALEKASFHIGQGVVGYVAETGAPLAIEDVAQEVGRSGPLLSIVEHGSVASVPMLHKGRVVGVMVFLRREVRPFDEDDLELLQALAALAAMAVVNADLYEKTLELSITDPLTQLINRREMERRLEIELVRSKRFSIPLSVLMIDVDHFKVYNNRMGHLLGDQALSAVADTMGATVRRVDAVARFGGEEFCVFLPRTSEEDAEDVAHKLRNAVQSIQLPGVGEQPLGALSVSIGLAVYPQDMPAAFEGSEAHVLLGIADRAAYEAKRLGRDKVVVASSLPPPVVSETDNGTLEGAGESPRQDV